MRIVIEVIPHNDQRYNTAGDWWIDDNGDWQIRVSRISRDVNDLHRRMEFLIGIHELVELALCARAYITEETVTEFDEWFAKEGNAGEPGDDITAPYYLQHQIATGIERIMAAHLGVGWKHYDDLVNAL